MDKKEDSRERVLARKLLSKAKQIKGGLANCIPSEFTEHDIGSSTEGDTKA